MAYQVLARKWRPQNFSSLVGQEAIVTALRNALAEGRIAHAYLFSGIRGVGKTTAARVLAKALNCERGPAPDPCNECTACIEITRGSDLDVLEVDAATYSKVEQVRELTESLRYGPARDRHKVVVLDEVHRLSRQAFDALLKIVEEPPPYLVFIFATTEIDAVPATILSRCQEYHFRRVSAPAVAGLLREICDSESIQASDSALRLIARAGEGSVRDAVALLDQLATFGSGTIADEAAVHLLGGLDLSLFRRLLGAVLEGDAVAVSREARMVEDEGWDARHVFGQFLTYCRDALHLALGGDLQQVDLVAEEAQALADLARGAGYENLLRLLNQLLLSEPMVRRSESGALAVEIAWLRAAELPKLTRVEDLLRSGAPATATPGDRRAAPQGHAASPAQPVQAVQPREATAPPRLSPPPAVPPATTARPANGPSGSAAPATAATPGDPATGMSTAPAPTAPAPMPAAAATAPQKPSLASAPAAPAPAPAAAPALASAAAPAFASAAAPAPANPGPAPATATAPATAATAPPPPATATSASASASAQTQIQAFLDEVSARKQPLAAYLEHAGLAREDGRLLILLPAGDAYLGSRLRQPVNRDTISAAVAKVWGEGATWDLAESPVAKGSAATAAGVATPRGEAAANPPAPLAADAAALIPAVQTLLDIFGGKVEAVEEHRSLREE